MKSINIIHLISVLFISIFLYTSCKKDNEWLQINSAEPEKELSEYLDSIFTRHNNCLTNFENDTLFHFIFSSNNFENIDNCHRISQVDFNNYGYADDCRPPIYHTYNLVLSQLLGL
jgi:hypothetical protein